MIWGEDSDRSLPATRRRREQSRRDGYVIHSRLLTTGVVLIICGLTWDVFGWQVLQSFAACFQHALSELPHSNGAQLLDADSSRRLLMSALSWGGLLALGALLAVGVQTRGWFDPGFALPHASRVFSQANLRRIGGTMGARLASAILSIIVCAAIGWAVWVRFVSPAAHVTGSTPHVAHAWGDAIETMTLQVGAGCMALGLLDLFWRYRRREARLRMTPTEWAEEQRSAGRGPAW